ncbi:MAG: energy transducer TonB [Luteimonas sp.]
MSDPMPQRLAEPPQNASPRRRSTSLVAALALIALMATGWYVYNKRASNGGVAVVDPPPSAPASEAMTSAASGSVEKQPAASPPNAPPVAKAKAKPRHRDAALIAQPRPKYPPGAYRAGEQGTVLVGARVDAQGHVSDVAIVKRSGSRALDRAAVSEVRGWKFRPALNNGKPVASNIRVPVDYRLDDR